MNTAHWHLVLNHLPVIGTYFSIILLIAGMILKNQTLKNTSLCLFILTALLAIPVLLTGEGAEEVLESIGFNNKFFIERHEELAQNAFWLSVSVGIFSLGALLSRKKIKQARILIVTVLIAGLANSVLMTIAGNSGGEIRHTEIRTANSGKTETEEE